MRSHGRGKDRISLTALVALTDETAAVAAPLRERRVALTRPEAWSRMSVLERIVAAEREDPAFDYAAN